MSRSITVKVQRLTLIKALEESLQKKENEKAEYAKNRKAYEAECKKLNKEVFDKIRSGKIKADKLEVSVRNEWRPFNSNDEERKAVNISFTCSADSINYPEEPKGVDSYAYKREVEEIGNAIRILKLSNDELISTSSYKSVAQYL